MAEKDMDEEMNKAMKTVEQIGILKKALENRTKEIVAETLRELLKSDEFIELIQEMLRDMVREEVGKQMPSAPYNPFDKWIRPDEDAPAPIRKWYSVVDKTISQKTA